MTALDDSVGDDAVGDDAMSDPPGEPGSGSDVDQGSPGREPARGFAGWRQWLVRRPASLGGFVAAVVFFWLSLTPSLLPRPWFGQAAVSGIAVAIGYGIGSGVQALLRRGTWRPSARARALAPQVLLGVFVVGSAFMIWWSKAAQNELRRLMSIEEEPDYQVLAMVAASWVVASVLLFVARLVRSLARWLIRQVDRVAPRRVSAPVGVVLAALLVVGFAEGVLWRFSISTMNSMSSVTNGTTSDQAVKPTTEFRSGGPGSLIEWDSLGRQGRDFTGRGPSLADLEEFHGDGCCVEPIRIYAGLKSADTMRERAELAVRDLDRAGGFDRKVIGVFNATGTGWINPRVAGALEYLHEGDTAEISIQYSYLPSAVSFLVDQTVAAEAGRELIGAMQRRLDRIPPDERPKVVLFGESLGSFATESSFESVEELRAEFDGALLVGPTFENGLWRELTDGRRPGSPQWLPETDVDGVRFARRASDLDGFVESTPGSRVVFLQNSSDPITWWSAELLYRAPDWAGDPAAPDRSPRFRWMPIVTFWQVVADLADSLGVPTGYGHHFGSNVADGWIAVVPPDPGWTDADTERLKAAIGERG